MKTINLSKYLKNHIGEKFYNPHFGIVELVDITDFEQMQFIDEDSDQSIYTNKDCTSIFTRELVIFPSKNQRNWNVWIEEQKPKIWDDMKEPDLEIGLAISHLDYGSTEPIVRSTIALLKIHQLIEAGYGGNITKEEWANDNIVKYTIKSCCNDIVSCDVYEVFNHIAFHTEEQCKEFLSYSENIKLIREFYML